MRSVACTATLRSFIRSRCTEPGAFESSLSRVPQALLQSVLAQVLARVDSTVSGMGSPQDVLTLAVERSTRSAVLAAYEIMEQRQRQSTSRQQQQQRSQMPADPTADAEGVTDSEARSDLCCVLRLSSSCATSLKACMCI